jgi:hypothetical protein
MSARNEIHNRITSVLEWYVGCDVTPDTLSNIQRDVDAAWRDVRKELPKLNKFRAKVKFDGADVVVWFEPFDPRAPS